MKHLRIKLDLTHSRISTIDKANQILKPKGDKYYAFADINYHIYAGLGKVFITSPTWMILSISWVVMTI